MANEKTPNKIREAYENKYGKVAGKVILKLRAKNAARAGAVARKNKSK